MQPNSIELMHELQKSGFKVFIETHGEASIASIPPFVHIIMDIKTPGSRMCRGGFQENLAYLKPTDELKLVITDQNDYDWAKQLIKSQELPTKNIIFSAALPASDTPAPYTTTPPKELAENILKDQLPVRFQLQLHKQLWGDVPGK